MWWFTWCVCKHCVYRLLFALLFKLRQKMNIFFSVVVKIAKKNFLTEMCNFQITFYHLFLTSWSLTFLHKWSFFGSNLNIIFFPSPTCVSDHRREPTKQLETTLETCQVCPWDTIETDPTHLQPPPSPLSGTASK